jgi:hypothetical protein
LKGFAVVRPARFGDVCRADAMMIWVYADRYAPSVGRQIKATLLNATS